MENINMANRLKIYQINIRHFLSFYGFTDISQLELNFFINLKKQGFDTIWLMGMWQLPDYNIVKNYTTLPEQIENFTHLKPNFDHKNDICGSIFAIENYEIDSNIGNLNDLATFRKKLSEIGLKLLLDYVPNHFHINSQIVQDKPEMFISWPQDNSDNCNHLKNSYQFQNTLDNKFCVAHGKDPFFPAWFDTAQVNYQSVEYQELVKWNIKKISNLCDGIRVDMASLGLNRIFNNTFHTFFELTKYEKQSPNSEFWRDILEQINKENPGFYLIAESYWETQNELLEIGFDYVYLVEWMQMIKKKPHWDQLMWFRTNILAKYNERAIIFMENHDEERIHSIWLDPIEVDMAEILTENQISSFLVQWGQREGWKIRWPVQLRNIK